MAPRRSPILLLVVASVVVAGAWFVVTPRRAWTEFLRALAQNDQKSLAAVVDYPAVREHANADLAVALAQQTNGRQGVPAALRSELMKQMVDSMTSPHGLLQLVNGFSVPSGSGAPVHTTFHYHGLSKVDVLLGGTGSGDTGAGLFTFERAGTHWRLTRASSERIAALTPGS
jgi:hypothetical protein